MVWESLSGASDQSNGFNLLRTDPINRVEVSFKIVNNPVSSDAVVPTDATLPGGNSVPALASTPPTVVNSDVYIGGVGQYSGFLTRIETTRSRAGVFGYLGGFSSAFGERHSGGRPSATATWRGAMVGQSRGSIGNGAQLAGEAVLTYSVSDNTIDVAFAQVSAYDDSVTYSGPRSFTWNDLIVNSDGTFHIPGYTNDRSGTRLHPTLGYIEGDFYGPNAEETAGVFERDSVQGAWMAIRGN